MSGLDDVPYEILFEAALYMSPQDLARFCRTSQSMSVICDDEYFWKTKVEKDHGKHVHKMGTWKNTYKNTFSLGDAQRAFANVGYKFSSRQMKILHEVYPEIKEFSKLNKLKLDNIMDDILHYPDDIHSYIEKTSKNDEKFLNDLLTSEFFKDYHQRTEKHLEKEFLKMFKSGDLRILRPLKNFLKNDGFDKDLFNKIDTGKNAYEYIYSNYGKLGVIFFTDYYPPDRKYKSPQGSPTYSIDDMEFLF